MQRLTLVALCAIAALVYAQSNGFSSGGSFEVDQQTRFSARLKLVSRADCGCASANNPEGSWDGCDGSGSSSGYTSSGAESTDATPSGASPSGEEPTGSTPSGEPASSTSSGEPASSTSSSGDGETSTSSGFESSPAGTSALFTSTVAVETTTPPAEGGSGSCVCSSSTAAAAESTTAAGDSTTGGATDASTTEGASDATASSSFFETTTSEFWSTLTGGHDSTTSSGLAPSSAVPNSSGSGDSSGSGICETSGGYAEVHGGWFEEDYCFILQVFISWCEYLSEEDSIIFREFIDECQQTIIVNGEYTDEERLVLLQIRFQAFLEVHISISEIIQWKLIELDGFSWGLAGFLEGCQLDIIGISGTLEFTTEEVITITEGSCILTDAALEWAGSDQEKIECALTFNAAVFEVIEGDFSIDVKLSLLHEVFVEFSANYTQYSESFFAFTIDSYVAIGAFSDYCFRAWRVLNFDVVIGGDFSSCALLKAIWTLVEDTTLSVSFRSQLKQWHTSIEAKFNETTDIDVRIRYFGQLTYQYILLNNWDISVIFNCNITAEFGSIFELIDAYISYTNGQITIGADGGASSIAPSSEAPTTIAPSSEAPTTIEATTEVPTTEAATTEVPTTEAATTEKPTTEAAPTEKPTTGSPPSTGPPHGTGSCSEKYGVQAFSSNTTDLLTSIQTAQSSWSTSSINQFKGYQKKLYHLAADTSLSHEECFQQSKKVLVNFATHTSTIWKQVQEVQIIKWGGKVSGYCGCA